GTAQAVRKDAARSWLSARADRLGLAGRRPESQEGMATQTAITKRLAETIGEVGQRYSGGADLQGHGKVAFMQPEAALASAVGRGHGSGWLRRYWHGRPGPAG